MCAGGFKISMILAKMSANLVSLTAVSVRPTREKVSSWIAPHFIQIMGEYPFPYLHRGAARRHARTPHRTRLAYGSPCLWSLVDTENLASSVAAQPSRPRALDIRRLQSYMPYRPGSFMSVEAAPAKDSRNRTAHLLRGCGGAARRIGGCGRIPRGRRRRGRGV